MVGAETLEGAHMYRRACLLCSLVSVLTFSPAAALAGEGFDATFDRIRAGTELMIMGFIGAGTLAALTAMFDAFNGRAIWFNRYGLRHPGQTGTAIGGLVCGGLLTAVAVSFEVFVATSGVSKYAGPHLLAISGMLFGAGSVVLGILTLRGDPGLPPKQVGWRLMPLLGQRGELGLTVGGRF